MAIISGGEGDFFGSQEISLSAIKYLSPRIDAQNELLSNTYSNLGKMANRLKNYPQSSQFYLKSIELSKNEDSKNIYLNNLAVNLLDQLKYKEALKYFEKLINKKSIRKDPITFSRILSNTSKAKWLQNPRYNPLPNFLKALRIRQKGNDLFGQNASFAHLTDFYIDKNSDSALFYAHKMYHLTQIIKSADDRVYALERLIKLSAPLRSKQYFEIYKELKDSLETVRNAAKNQFAIIRYETEKSKADNLNLQKENAEKKYQISMQNFLLIGTLLLIIVVSIISVLWYKKRKQKLQLQAQNDIRLSQLKTSKKVHDVVANGLYQVMAEIENQDEIDKEHILDSIELLYEKSRDISYEEGPATNAPNFKERINMLLRTFGSKNTIVSIVGNEIELWEQVSPKAKQEITHILQELMVNMKKHSGANNVVLKFEQVGNQVNIYYTDDGVGIKGIPTFNNGLTNTGNRIEGIDGKITFDTKNDRGLKVHISFPTT